MPGIRTLLGRLARLTISPPVQPSMSCKPHRFRPRLEFLDDRVVPSATWTGAVSTDAGDAANWLNGVMPVAGGEVDFVASYAVDCVGLAGQFGVVSLASGYTGTVTVGSQTSISEFIIHDGALVAPAALTLGFGNISGGALTAESDLSCSSLGVQGGVTTVQGVATLGTLTLSSPVDPSGETVSLAGGGTLNDGEIHAGTLSLGAAVTAGVFNLSGGEVDQPNAGADLTVQGGGPGWSGDSFTWTGGTLNNTTNLANVTITGSTTTGAIAPTNGGTVNLGSNFTLSSGARATMAAGTIDLTNSDLTFDVLASCSFNVDPRPGLSAVIASTFSTNFQVRTGAAWTLLSGDWTFQGDVRNAGTFTLGAGTLAAIEGTNNPNDPDNRYSYLQSAGATSFYGSSTLLTNEGKGVKITAGILATKEASTDRSDHDSSALIATDELLVTGGDIYIGYGFSHLFFGTLSVSGDVLWIGGPYHPCVRSYANGSVGDSDLWDVGGQFELGNNFTPTITPIVADAEGAVVDRAESGIYYVIIKSGAASFPPPEGAPAYDTDLWNLITVNDPGDNTKVRQYNLLSK
jgi:hypothetical protein